MDAIVHIWRRVRVGSKWVGLALAVLAAFAIVGLFADPFGWRTKQRAYERARVQNIQWNAAARALEAEGEVKLRRGLEKALAAELENQSAVARLAIEAGRAPDAGLPLPAERVRRIRDHDAVLCRLSQLRGCELLATP